MARSIHLLKRHQFFPDARTRLAVHREVRQSPIRQHRHEFFELVIILSGTGIHVTGDFRHRIGPGDILLLNSRRAHGYEETESLNLINILVRDDFLARLSRELGQLPGYHALFALEPERWRQRAYSSRLRLPDAELNQIEEWTGRLEEETHRSGQGGSLLAEAYMTLIVGVLSRRYGQKVGAAARPVGRFGQILSRIERELDHPLRVADLARQAGMSERTFHRRFRSTIGTSPAAYLLKRRMGRATELLRQENPRRLISEVAAACGFGDSNYFSRCFRKVMGKNPRHYQRLTCREESLSSA